jgi:parallel beta-helix repeat protein
MIYLANPSLIEHCIIEYGYKDAGESSPESYGGGIHIDYNNLTVSNTIIRNNTAKWGGGLFIAKNRYPVIVNTTVRDNTAFRGGGGIYLYDNSIPQITNSIVYNNNTTATGGGGIFAGPNTGARITNTLIISNNSTTGTGKNVYLYYNTSQKPVFVNCVIWGSAGSISYTGQSHSHLDFVNCALQGGAVNYLSCIDLNAVNDAADGPNFAATDGTDWSISFLSPLRDMGINSYPGTTISATDYYGNGRIGPADIGIHELQYSRWKTDAGSTDWNTGANWYAALVPTSTSDIVIPAGAANYPINPSAPDVTIGAGKYFIMESGSRATVGSLTNNGTMQLKADASGFASLIMNSYSRGAGGTEEIELFLSGGGTEENEDYKWHYISSPVASLSTNIFTAVTPDLAQYVESRPTLSLRQGWVAYDGYVYSTGLMNGPTFSNLSTGTNGKGYNYFDYYDHLFTFSGLFNTSTVTAPLGFSGNATLHGFNLLGNPFMSGLDWNYIISDPGFPANTSKSLYFTRDNTDCSYASGVGVPSDVNGIIPPMQGFFTKTYATGNSIVLSADARTHDNIHARYKGYGTEQVIPMVRLSLAGPDITDETVVRFDEGAKTDWDNDFDASKMFALDTRTYICTQISEELYSINGQPFPETTIDIPIVLNLIADGSHTISTIELQGLQDYRVRLVDLEVNTSRELSTTPQYTFNSPKGLISDRFVLRVATVAYGTETVTGETVPFNIYQLSGKIQIMPESNIWEGKTGSVNIMDITGRTTSVNGNVRFNSGNIITIDSPEQTGIYIVDIRSGVLRYTRKIVVKQDDR